MIRCCECGTEIEPNPKNVCVGCLRKHVDITEDIPKQAIVEFCRNCERYYRPPNEWVHCTLGSRELLSLCLKKLKGLNKVKLIDAGFMWTEPNSKRLKVKLTVRGEVFGCLTLQQVFVVEYTVHGRFCDACHRSEAKNYWKASVQVRQNANNKRTIYYLEQLVLKHNAHADTIGIKENHEGLDFFYAAENTAKKMVDFLLSVLPCRYEHSKKLISHDTHSNTYNYKFTYSVEIVPLSKDSIVCLPKKLAVKLGGIRQLCVVSRVCSTVRLIDPATGQIADLNSLTYWKNPFKSIFDPKQLIEYIVMDIQVIEADDRIVFPGQGPVSHKHLVADVWVVRASDLGRDTATIHTRTHLGRFLKHGDTVLGYNIKECNINDNCFDQLKSDEIADVILIKKQEYDKCYRKHKRNWKLKHILNDQMETVSETRDYNDFLDDLENDIDYRQNINIYLDPSCSAAGTANQSEASDSEPNCSRIRLSEMRRDFDTDSVAAGQQEAVEMETGA